MKKHPSTTTLALLLFMPTLACGVENSDMGPGDVEELQAAPTVESEELSSWEAEKLDETDAALLIDYAEQLGFTLVPDLSFAYPMEGIVLAELEDSADQSAFLSFDVDDEGATRVTMLTVPEPDEPQVYWVVDGEVTLASGGSDTAMDVNASQTSETKCVSWGHCNCVEFAAAVGVCAVNGMYTEAFYSCIRFFCE